MLYLSASSAQLSPTELEVTPEALVPRFPGHNRAVPRDLVEEVGVYEGDSFGQQLGSGLRVGAGGLWGHSACWSATT